MDAPHLSLKDPVLCLERFVIYSSPEVLLPEVRQGRLYPFDIHAVIGLGSARALRTVWRQSPSS